MMVFHVPDNVCSDIKCGSESACDQAEDTGGFAAWYSCPVCAYRICSGCASGDILIRQFAQFGTEEKKKTPLKETQDGDSAIPGLVTA